MKPWKLCVVVNTSMPKLLSLFARTVCYQYSSVMAWCALTATSNMVVIDMLVFLLWLGGEVAAAAAATCAGAGRALSKAVTLAFIQALFWVGVFQELATRMCCHLLSGIFIAGCLLEYGMLKIPSLLRCLSNTLAGLCCYLCIGIITISDVFEVIATSIASQVNSGFSGASSRHTEYTACTGDENAPVATDSTRATAMKLLEGEGDGLHKLAPTHLKYNTAETTATTTTEPAEPESPGTPVRWSTAHRSSNTAGSSSAASDDGGSELLTLYEHSLAFFRAKEHADLIDALQREQQKVQHLQSQLAKSQRGNAKLLQRLKAVLVENAKLHMTVDGSAAMLAVFDKRIRELAQQLTQANAQLAAATEAAVAGSEVDNERRWSAGW